MHLCACIVAATIANSNNDTRDNKFYIVLHSKAACYKYRIVL